MPKFYESKKFNPILFNLKRSNLTKIDLCKSLKMGKDTLNGYISNPHKFSVDHITIMSGLFGISPESFLYLLIRNKPQVKESDKWYIDEQIKKADNLQ